MASFSQFQQRSMASPSNIEAQRRAAAAKAAQLKGDPNTCHAPGPAEYIAAGAEVAPVVGVAQGAIGTAMDVAQNFADGKPQQIPGSIISGVAATAAGIFPGGATVAREAIHGAAVAAKVSPQYTPPPSAVGTVVRGLTCNP